MDTTPADSKEIELNIACPDHPDEVIERISLDSSIEKEILCVECLLNLDDLSASAQNLVTIDHFVDLAAKFYENSKKMISEPAQSPQEYLDLVAKQGDNIEKVNKHIQKEKARIEERFNTIIEEFTKICKQKKEEYIALLDKQLMNYRYNYIYFEKQLRKVYPSENQSDVALYPTKENLLEKLGKLTNSTQLLALVKNIKQDLNEAKYNPNAQENQEENRKKHLEILEKAIQNQTNKLPSIVTAQNTNQDKVIAELKESLDKSLSKLLELENEVVDFTKGESVPNSKILTSQEQISLLKKWLKKDVLNLKLLYRASKDGFTGNAFHSKCDGKSETISLIKTENTNKIFGGYLDKPWQTKEAWINSSKTFIFSFNTKEKYNIKPGHEMYAAYGSASYGPSFGGGYDFHVSGKNGGANLYSFEGLTDITLLTGGSSFTCSEIEVFQITKDSGSLDSGSSKKSSKDAITAEAKQKVADYLGVSESKFKLVYKGTQDGMNPEKFHEKCDNLGPTAVFVKAKDSGDIVGGYTTQPWSQKEVYSSDYDAFVFSIQKDLFCPVSIGESAIFLSSSTGPYFGDDETLVVFKEKQNGTWNVTSNAIDCYQDGDLFSGGHFSFEPEEVEVYEIPL